MLSRAKSQRSSRSSRAFGGFRSHKCSKREISCARLELCVSY
ncbi:hypothetical protein HMPREF1584_01336 [Gardnerella vaginalis JCP8481A]|nr:hypothetical protein HMPREF1584_01336 [Gardnerella vaginalis JCP8481A]